MPCADAKPGSGLQQRNGRKAHDNHSNSSFKQFPRKGRDFRWVVKHDRHNWTVIIAQNLQSHLRQFHAEIVAIIPQRLQLPLTDFLVHNNFKRTNDLLTHNWTHRIVVQSTCTISLQMFNHVLACRNISTHSTKTLCKRAHENIHVFRVNTTVFTTSSSSYAHRANTVRFIQIQIRLVPFGDAQNGLEIAVFALHAVHPLYYHKNFIPWSS
mmetsp:Transcript_10156/g.15137  ORF Transcript_10156/g.15137 Transcript_10156/m.15137 type:complete len:211 (+) Transcript_10156:229-861(+)